jgi:broad specificity phosphatase PhoE
MSTIVSVIASHNTRLQCLIDFIRDETTPKIRFMNCVIFKLVITNDQLDLSMIYTGELEEHEQRKISVDRPYYVKDLGDCYPRGKAIVPDVNDDEDVEWIGAKPSGIKPCNVYVPYTTRDFKTRLKLPAVLPHKYIIYLVRHGQALHNASNTYGMALDTPLTFMGHQQAHRAGIALKQHIDATHPEIPPQQYYFFVSDLLRTQQTCKNILRKLFSEQQYGNKFIVLQCAHEITSKGNNKGNCDQVASDSSLYKKVALENYSMCTTNQGKINFTACHGEDNDWDSYLKFYGNKIRAENNSASNYVRSFFQPKTEMKHCRDTNMISEAIQIIHERSRRRGGKKSKKFRNNKKNTKKLKYF